jgi:hypothetical protein
VNMLRNLKRGEAKDHGYPIEVQVGLDLRDVTSLGRIARRLLDKEIHKLVARHGDLADPATGERPTILFYSEGVGKPGTIRLKTDSATLRAHLAAKGVAVLGETVEGDAGHAPSQAA